MIVATALGAQKGMMIWKNFAKGLMTFEFIKVSLVIITSTVNQYMAGHAADFIASVGQNPMTIKAIPYTMHYMASMAGISGILGIAAIFMVPAMIFSGEVGMAAGALSGLAQRYKGSDIQTATNESAQQKAQNDAYERELQDQAILDHMGISVPQGMGASEYYSLYKKGAETANAGFGAMRMGTNAMASAGHAVKGQTMQSISAMQTLDGGASMNDFVSAGVGQGMSMVKNVSSMGAYGANMTTSNAKLSGEFEGIMSASKDSTIAADTNLRGYAKTLGVLGADKMIQQATGAQNAQVFNKDGTEGKEHAKFMEGGTELQRKALNEKELAMGAAMHDKSEVEKKQMYSDLQAASAGKTLDEFSQVKGSRKTLDVQHDKDGYISSVNNKNDVSWEDTNGETHHMSRAKANELLGDAGIRGVIGKGAGMYSVTDKGTNMDVISNNAMASEAENIKSINAAVGIAGGVGAYASFKSAASAIQTAEVVGGTKGKLEEGLKASNPEMSEGDRKKLAEAIVQGSTEGAEKFKNALKSLGDLSQTQSGAKIRSDIESISTAGGDEPYRGLQASQAKMKTAQSMKTIEAQQQAGFMDENGNITEVGMNAYGIVPGEQANALKGKQKIGQSIGSTLQKLKDDQKKIQLGLGKTDAQAEEYAEGLVAPFRDKNGKFLEGQAFWNKQAELKSGVFAASNSMLLGNGNLFAGAISDSGMTGRVSSGLSTSKNNQYDEKAGKRLDAGVEGEINKNIGGASAAERAKYAMNPKKWIEGIAAKGHEAGVRSLEALGFSKDDAESIYSELAAPVVGVAGTIGIAEVMGRISGKGSVVGKVFKRGKKDSGDNMQTSKSSSNETVSKTSNPDNPQPDSEVNNKGQHDDSFHKNSINNSTTKPENFKAEPGYKTTKSGIFVPENIPVAEEVSSSTSKIAELASKGAKFMKIGGKALGAAGLAYAGYEAFEAAKDGDGKGVVSAIDPTLITTVLNNLDHIAETGRNQIPNIGIQSDGTMPTTGGAVQGHNPLFHGSNNNASLIAAIQNDPGMPTAIDTFNTQQNVHAIQNTQPGRVLSMQTRGGEMEFIGNSKTGNMDVHVPDAPFATHTNIPVTQFQSIFNDPTQQQQFAQMVAQSNFDTNNSDALSNASNIETFKQELNSNFAQSKMQTMKNTQYISQTSGMVEELQDSIDVNISDFRDEILSDMEELHGKVDRL